jgi:hypothetical protein
MRRLAPPVFLALLAACSVTTTGAPCSSDLNGPSDQGCGSDGACSTAALSCAGHTEAGECVPGTSCASGQVVTCTAAAGVCSTRTSVPCADPGQSCVASGGGAACACPIVNPCTQLDATRCSAAADQVLRCRPVTAGSACLAWQTETSCAAGGLVCSASACICPPNVGSVFVADAIGGSPAGAAPHATGLLAPAACRYQTLTEALAAANARGAGSKAMAAGWSAGVPGGVVVFAEPGGLTVGAGVTLSTDDPTPTTGHYALTSAASVPGALVAIGPGGAMSGFEVRNAASSGDGVRTACPTSADTLPVSLTTVRIAAAAAGPPAARLATGVHVAGYCGASLAGVTVEGAATGIAVDSVAPSVETTASSPRVTGSTVAGAAVVEGKLTLTGGTVDGNAAGVLVGATGTGAPTFIATGTTFSGNSGDAVYVARGTLVSDGCPYVNNGTHVHVEPAIGSPLSVTVRNSRGSSKMTGAADSALRVIAAGLAANSSLTIQDNDILQNSAIQTYTLGTFLRRGGGMVFTSPMPSTVLFEGNTIASNAGDQILVAASGGALDLRGGSTCGTSTNNSIGCYSAGAVGVYSNGTAVQIDRNHWTQQPAVPTVDYAGSGIAGASAVCTPAVLVCP